MSSDLNCFCIDCRETIANSGGSYEYKEELQKIKDGKDEGIMLKYNNSKRVRECSRAGHDLVWEYL